MLNLTSIRSKVESWSSWWRPVFVTEISQQHTDGFQLPFGYFSSWYQHQLGWGRWLPSRGHVKQLQWAECFHFDFDCLKLIQLVWVVRQSDDGHWLQQDAEACFYFCLLCWCLLHVQPGLKCNQNYRMMKRDFVKVHKCNSIWKKNERFKNAAF